MIQWSFLDPYDQSWFKHMPKDQRFLVHNASKEINYICMGPHYLGDVGVCGSMTRFVSLIFPDNVLGLMISCLFAYAFLLLVVLLI